MLFPNPNFLVHTGMSINYEHILGTTLESDWPKTNAHPRHLSLNTAMLEEPSTISTSSSTAFSVGLGFSGGVSQLGGTITRPKIEIKSDDDDVQIIQ